MRRILFLSFSVVPPHTPNSLFSMAHSRQAPISMQDSHTLFTVSTSQRAEPLSRKNASGSELTQFGVPKLKNVGYLVDIFMSNDAMDKPYTKR